MLRLKVPRLGATVSRPRRGATDGRLTLLRDNQGSKKSDASVMGKRVPVDLQPTPVVNDSYASTSNGVGYASSSVSYAGDDIRSSKGSWAGSSVRFRSCSQGRATLAVKRERRCDCQVAYTVAFDDALVALRDRHRPRRRLE